MLYILLACFCWAIDPILRSFLFDQSSPLVFIFLGECLITLFVSAENIITRNNIFRGLTLKTLFFLFCFSLACSLLPIFFYTSALKILGPGQSVLFLKLQQFISILAALVLLKEPLKKHFFLLFFLALIGAFLLGSENSYSLNSTSFLGYIYITLAILGWGISPVIAKILLKHCSSETLMFFRFFFGALCLIPFVLFQNFTLSLESQGIIFLIALVPGFLGLKFYYKGLKTTLIQKVALLELSHPFFSLILSSLFFGLQLTFVQFIGGSLIITSALILDLKKN
jgi:drug/metabolite transporter (DMT)-like permease